MVKKRRASPNRLATRRPAPETYVPRVSPAQAESDYQSAVRLDAEMQARDAARPTLSRRRQTRERLVQIEHLELVAARYLAMQDVVADQVRQARSIGVTWLQIGAALGLTAEGARTRYGRGR